MKAHQNKQHQQNKQKNPPNYNMLFHNRVNIKKNSTTWNMIILIFRKTKCSDRIQERMRNKGKTFYNEEVNYRGTWEQINTTNVPYEK